MMDLTKPFSAILTAGIAFFVFGWIGDSLIRPERLAKLSIKIEAQEAAAPSGAAEPQALPPIAAALASADATAGGTYAKNVCAACHSFNEGGKSGIGPNLYNVVGKPVGHMDGFAYSAALKKKSGPWTFSELNAWLYKPAAYAPGTKMTYAGVSNAKDRANVILYLRSLSATPEPLPSPDDAPAAESAQAEPIEALMATADPKRGQADTMKYACIACHTFTNGGKAGVGPNLYGVVGGPHAHMPGFAYSPALKSKEGNWTYDELNKWLTKPSAYAPGTKMTLGGVPDPKDRADLIAYLRSLSDNPEPLPAK